MISVEQALEKILTGVSPAGVEQVLLSESCGRVLAQDVAAGVTQPPFDSSAMDGYAVRAQDASSKGARLRLIGTSAAGHPFQGKVSTGETVRIFTGAPVPAGADAVVIQENVSAISGDMIEIIEGAVLIGRHIRRSGLDFRRGDALLRAGHILRPQDIALAAAMNLAHLPCQRKPIVAILATGDELILPGHTPQSGQIICSSSFGLAAYLRSWGTNVLDLGIAPDQIDAIRSKGECASTADLFITLGGASVGDHDLVQAALKPELEVSFWKIAMRPGKPLIFGRYKSLPFFGLPGNPVSGLVCALLFVRPLVRAMLGAAGDEQDVISARLTIDLPANDQRQDYMRCQLVRGTDGFWLATPFPLQDSSMLRPFSQADGLLIRPPLQGALGAGDLVQVLPI